MLQTTVERGGGMFAGQMLGTLSVIPLSRMESPLDRHRDDLRQKLGRSSPLRTVVDQAVLAAENSCNLVIQGEAGTGKTYLAGLIHGNRGRGRSPFSIVNCAGHSVQQLEAELFGRRGKEPGKLSVAAGGTILLRQVEDAPLGLQDKVAGMIHERRLFRKGESAAQPLEVRLMATVRGDAATAHREGRLSEALYYQLTEQVIALPSLHDLPKEIPRLAAHFLHEAADDLQRAESRLTDDAVAVAVGYSWPGNIRQLKNVMRRAAIYHVGQIGRDLLESLLPAPVVAEAKRSLPPSLRLEEVEQWAIGEALLRTGGRKMQAAELLGMEYQRFRRKLSKYGKHEVAS